MAAQTRQPPVNPGLKALQQQHPVQHESAHALFEHTHHDELPDAPLLQGNPESASTKKLSDDGMNSASSSPPATPSVPPSLDLATPTPSQTASPARCEDQYEKHLMNYETEKNVYTPMNNDTPSNADHDNISAKLSIDAKMSSTLGRIQSIIQTQFDLEILLKHRELRVIDDEIAKIHVMMLQIKRSCENPKQAIASHEPPEFAEFYAQYLDPKSFSRTQPLPSNHYATRSRHNSFNHNNSSLYPPKILRSTSFSSTLSPHVETPSKPQTRQQQLQLAPQQKIQCVIRRNDGVLVRLVCPKCQRENFGSAQGFINHCRISHALEFTTHDSAAIVCGVEAEEQDEIGLEAQKLNAEKSAKGVTPVDPSATEEITLTTPAPIKVPAVAPQQFACGPDALTKNLSLFVKKRRIGQQDIDVDELAKKSIEKFAKGHLLDEEEEEEDTLEELGDEATPFERALAEAKKLKLDVDEIRRTAHAPSTASSSNGKPGRKKRGTARGRRGSSRVSSASATLQRSQFAPVATPPAITRSVSASTPSSTVSSISTTIGSATAGGKYRPGFAPSHWSHLGGKGNESVPGKTLPGQQQSETLPTLLQQRQLPRSASPKVTRSKTRKTEQETKTEKSTTVSTRNTVKRKSYEVEDEDDINSSQLDEEDDDEDDEEDDETDGQDSDRYTFTKKSGTNTSSQYNRSHQRSTGKTLPGSRTASGVTSSGTTAVDSLQKFIPLSRFF